MMIWLLKGHMYGSMAHRHILIGNQMNLMVGTPRVVHILLVLVGEVNGMMRAVPVVLDLYAKQIYIEHVQPVLAEKLHY